jgi:hypothetical protein
MLHYDNSHHGYVQDIHLYGRYLHTYVHPPVSGPCLAQSCQPCLSQLLGIPVVATVPREDGMNDQCVDKYCNRL